MNVCIAVLGVRVVGGGDVQLREGGHRTGVPPHPPNQTAVGVPGDAGTQG